MRPVRLEVDGFTAFRARTIVDFDGVDLFALVGPTGAGKTSVIDAVTFALYGTVPRLDDRRAVAPVISQNLTEARVRLDFTVDGVAHTAVRVVRATKGGATTREARLQRGDEVLAGTADEVTEAVGDLLGLGFEHFTTCVSLPQGQFARFLHDKPNARQDLLVRLLDLGLYDRVGSAARQRAALDRNAADVAAGQLERLAGATPEARAAAAERAAGLAELGDRLAAARPGLDDRVAAAAAERAAAEEAAARAGLLDGLAPPAGVPELAGELAEADRMLARCRELDEEAAEAVTAAEEAMAALPDRAGLDAARADHARAAELAGTLARGETAAGEAARGQEAAEAAAAEARVAHAGATVERDRVLVELRARALVPELVVGDACPVCGQEVHALPAHEAAPERDRAERAAADAAARVEQADRALTAAHTHQARVDEKLARVRADHAEVTARLTDVPSPAALADRLAALDEAATALDKARQAERDAHKAVAAATRRREQLAAREGDARRAFDAARDAVAALGPPAAERRDLAADWAALAAWAADRVPALAEAAATHLSAAEAAAAAAAAGLAELVDACRALGVDVPSPRRGAAAWPGEAVAAEAARADEEVKRIDERLADAGRLRAEAAAATGRAQVADLLAGHLAANRFEKWLLDEAVHELVAGASVTLAELSGGAYALAVDRRSGGFAVVDHAHASQVRSARTLSGGETFLASLALALALADQVAGLAAAGTARLEALFLDEGFGALDPDTLDVVASAIDELGARGRMVGVVTHVRELAERLPVRFEVRKVGGSSVVERVEA
ncbi:MAG TPA: SMC family ATPase [Acidimicrobiales bacterium]|nr:SMC family ATPase [Acidimicrobiales bacterium]